MQIHIVQTSACHPIADAFDTYGGEEETSLADAIVDHVARRRPALVELIKESGGNGWVASNDDIYAAQEMVEKHTGLSISSNSALSVVGAMQAATQGWEINGSVVCLICGE